MEKNIPIRLQEVIVTNSDPVQQRLLSSLKREGLIRKIAPRIYSGNFSDTPEVIIRRNLFAILGALYPGALLSHRSALEFQPTGTGKVFLTHSYSKGVSLPGITLQFMAGPDPTEGDIPFVGGLRYSQQARAMLENLQVSRKPGPDSKTVSLPDIENRLEHVLSSRGEEGLNALRDRAAGLADHFGWQSEFKKLNNLIGALLNTKPTTVLTSPLTMARVMGAPYDPLRLALFEKLFVQLQQEEFPNRPDRNTDERAFKNFAFFEAYFSNYIEGTVFEIDEAKQIIGSDTPMPMRDEDSHDILGTYKLVSNRGEMQVVPRDSGELLNILQYRHKVLLSARISRNPGEFKEKNNRAGETHFVDYNLVRGTLIKGYEFYRGLIQPFAKAAYMMFLISEVHPFLDGNGRIARVMMNAELVHAGQSRIIIPAVFRDDYLLTLRMLTREQNPGPFIRMLDKAQRYSESITGTMEVMQTLLERSNAFREPDEASLVS